jgi:hypothetical protein
MVEQCMWATAQGPLLSIRAPPHSRRIQEIELKARILACLDDLNRETGHQYLDLQD